LTLAPDDVGRTSVRPGRAKARPTSEQLIRIARTRWKLILATIAAALVVAAILAAALPKRYRATAVGVVAPLTTTLTPSEAFHGVEALDRRSVVATVAALPSTAWSQHRDYDITAAVLPNTNLVRIDVDANSPEMASSVANTTLNELGVQTTSMFKYYGVTPVTRALPPTAASSPHRARILGAGLIIGLLLAVALAYVLDAR
jgi:capsular polysaccharide biosynthesis protein